MADPLQYWNMGRNYTPQGGGGLGSLAEALMSGMSNAMRLRLGLKLQEEQATAEEARWRSRAQFEHDLAQNDPYRRAQLEAFQAEAAARRRREELESLTVDQFANEEGFQVKPGFRGKTIGQIRAAGISLESIFTDPKGEAQRQARDRLTNVWSRYRMEQIQADPQLREGFMADMQAAGLSLPTRRVPEVTTRQVPQTFTSTPAITGTGPGLARAGLPQTVRTGVTEEQRIPTGQMVTEPILPQMPEEYDVITVLDKRNGRMVTQYKVPKGTRIETIDPKDPSRVAIFDANGKFVRTAEAPAGTQFHFLPRPPVSGGGRPPQAPGGLLGMLTLRAQGLPTGNPQIDRLTPAQAEQLSRDPRINRPDLLEQLGISLGAGTPAAPQAPTGGQPAAPQAGAQPQRGAPSKDAQDAVNIYRQTKKPIPQALWRTFSPQEQAWLRSQGVQVSP